MMNISSYDAPETRAADIWWCRLSSSLQLMSALEQSFSGDRSVVLTAKDGIPWRNDFYGYVETSACGFFANKRLRVLKHAPGEQPGAQVLTLCQPETRNKYWPGAGGIEQYLADSKDVSLCGSFVWVEGIETKGDYDQWIEFVTRYSKNTSEDGENAVFIIEYAKKPVSPPKTMTLVEYSISAFDRYALCMIYASEFSGSERVKQYTAELAYHMGGENAELCGELIQTGLRLAEDPVFTAGQSAGSEISPEMLDSAIWNAQVKLSFPVIEAFRVGFIKRYGREIDLHLPVPSMFGSSVDNAMDLDIGNLFYLVNQKHLYSEPEDSKTLGRIHYIRNQLAHNNNVEYSEMEYIFGLQV